MTTQQLKDLITGTLGPIVDAAARIADTNGRSLLSSQAKDRNLIENLVYLVQVARHDGALAAAPGISGSVGGSADTQIATRADQDWTAIVAA